MTGKATTNRNPLSSILMVAYTGYKLLDATHSNRSGNILLMSNKAGLAFVGYQGRDNTFSTPVASVLPKGLTLTISGRLLCSGGGQLDFFWVDTKSLPRHIFSLDDGLSWSLAEDTATTGTK